MVIETSRTAGIEIADDYCSRCGICVAVCPFEAISKDEKQNKIILDVEECRVCGLCVSACPLSAIDLVYYDVDSLTKKVQKQMSETGAKTLVLTCRGSNPVSYDIEEKLKDENVENFVSLRLPCVGRVPPEFYLKNLASGVEKMLVLQCEEDFCRFKKGSQIGINRFELLKDTVKELGYNPDNLVIKKDSMKAVYDTEKCVGCGKCAFVELCKLEEGTELAERNFSALKTVLKQYNLENRFDTFKVSPKYPGEFNAKMEEFKQKISSIPKPRPKPPNKDVI